MISKQYCLKNKKSLNLLSFLLKTTIVVFLSLIFIFYLVSINDLEYNDNEVIANLIINKFINSCLINFTYIDYNRLEKNCLKLPENALLKVVFENKSIFIGNKDLVKMEVFCDKKGSVYCYDKKLIGFNMKSNNNLTNLEKINLEVILYS